MYKRLTTELENAENTIMNQNKDANWMRVEIIDTTAVSHVSE